MRTQWITCVTGQGHSTEQRAQLLTDLIDQRSDCFGKMLQIVDIGHVDMEELAENIDDLSEKVQNATNAKLA